MITSDWMQAKLLLFLLLILPQDCLICKKEISHQLKILLFPVASIVNCVFIDVSIIKGTLHISLLNGVFSEAFCPMS